MKFQIWEGGPLFSPYALWPFDCNSDCLVQPRIPGFPLDRPEKRQAVFSDEGPRVSKMSLALEQPQGCSSANFGVAPGQETLSGLPGLRPKILLAPSPIDLGESQSSGLHQAIRIPTFPASAIAWCKSASLTST